MPQEILRRVRAMGQKIDSGLRVASSDVAERMGVTERLERHISAMAPCEAEQYLASTYSVVMGLSDIDIGHMLQQPRFCELLGITDA